MDTLADLLPNDEKQDSPNITLIKALYTALRNGDKESVSKLLVDNPTWNVSPGFPDSGIYHGMTEIFGNFYKNLRSRVYSFRAKPEVFIDGGNLVVVLGFYEVLMDKDSTVKHIRFSHTWKITPDNRIEGVWHVADSALF